MKTSSMELRSAYQWSRSPELKLLTTNFDNFVSINFLIIYITTKAFELLFMICSPRLHNAVFDLTIASATYFVACLLYARTRKSNVSEAGDELSGRKVKI